MATLAHVPFGDTVAAAKPHIFFSFTVPIKYTQWGCAAVATPPPSLYCDIFFLQNTSFFNAIHRKDEYAHPHLVK
jgi:hypothetical protein